MDPRARERLSAAAQEFMAAEPWTRLSPRHLVGIRDEETGLLACALLGGWGGRHHAVLLGLGPEAFERFSGSWRDLADACDLPEGIEGLIFSTLTRRAAQDTGSDWKKLGRWRRLALGACTCLNPEDVRRPSTREADFLARALSALARWADPGCPKSFLAPPPAFPVL